MAIRTRKAASTAHNAKIGAETKKIAKCAADSEKGACAYRRRVTVTDVTVRGIIEKTAAKGNTASAQCGKRRVARIGERRTDASDGGFICRIDSWAVYVYAIDSVLTIE
jgi:hypothetical protein